MFPEPIKKVLWKAVLAKGCFCFHKIKLPQPDGLSAISFNHHQWLRLTDMPSCEPASSVVAAKPRCDLRVKKLRSERGIHTEITKIAKERTTPDPGANQSEAVLAIFAISVCSRSTEGFGSG